MQDHALRDYSVSIHESMYYGNGAALGWVLLICIGTGELVPSFEFFAASPQAMALLLLRSLFFYLGAYVYQLLLKDSGAVYAVAVMTLRKSLTVLLSFALFPKPWSSSYGWGLVLLGGLGRAPHRQTAAAPEPAAVDGDGGASHDVPLVGEQPLQVGGGLVLRRLRVRARRVCMACAHGRGRGTRRADTAGRTSDMSTS